MEAALTFGKQFKEVYSWGLCWDKDGLEFSTSAERSRSQLLSWIAAQKASGVMNKISYTSNGLEPEVSFQGGLQPQKQ